MTFQSTPPHKGRDRYDCNSIPNMGQILRKLPISPFRRVNAALAILNLKKTDMERTLGVSHLHLHKVLKGDRKSPPLQRKVADYLGVKICDIWPEQSEEQAAA